VISEHRSLAKAESTDEEDTPSRANSAVRALEPEEIDVLLEQGERFIAAGDIVTARLIFERAAKAENATAALALAAAYDPIVLTKLGVLGIDMDVEKARLWYRKAESLGSAQAVQQLRALAER
jgi:TPR repeat protein